MGLSREALRAGRNPTLLVGKLEMGLLKEAHELEREFAGGAGAGKALSAIVIHHRAVARLLLPALANMARRSAEAAPPFPSAPSIQYSVFPSSTLFA